MGVNKVVLGEDTLIDLTGDTVSADKLSKGVTAHDMAGEPIVGTMEAGGGKKYTFTDGLTETDGTVKWDLNDRIKAGSGNGSIVIGSTQENIVSTGTDSLIFGKCDTHINDYGIINSGNNSLCFGETLYRQRIRNQGNGNLLFGVSERGYADFCRINAGTQTKGSLYFGVFPQSNGIIGGNSKGSLGFGYTYGIEGNNSIDIYGTGSCGFGDTTFGTIFVSGKGSFAHGSGVNASSDYQTVSGKCNVPDTTGFFADIIGNGTRTDKSNASALDWQGNQYLSGDIYTNCTDYTTTSAGLNTPRCGGQKLIPIPEPPSSGTYVLKAVDGVMSWVAE